MVNGYGKWYFFEKTTWPTRIFSKIFSINWKMRFSVPKKSGKFVAYLWTSIDFNKLSLVSEKYYFSRKGHIYSFPTISYTLYSVTNRIFGDAEGDGKSF